MICGFHKVFYGVTNLKVKSVSLFVKSTKFTSVGIHTTNFVKLTKYFLLLTK